jgi:hypothetical protein
MIKGPGSSSTVDETDTPLVSGKEKTGISSPTLSRGANGLGGLPVSLAVAIEVSFSLLYHPPPRHAPVARQFGLHGKHRRQYQHGAASCSAKPAARSFYSERAE